jgi:hypothetical protein
MNKHDKIVYVDIFHLFVLLESILFFFAFICGSLGNLLGKKSHVKLTKIS